MRRPTRIMSEDMLLDRWGARIGYAAVMIFWSLAPIGHAVANSLAASAVDRAVDYGASKLALGLRDDRHRCWFKSCART